MFKVAIIEDSTIFRIGLKVLLERRYEEIKVLEASNGEGYEERLVEFGPDLILLGTPAEEKIDGFVLVGKFKKLFPSAPVIVFDALGDYNHAIRFIKGQANGYLSKIDSEEELWACIDAVMNGKNYVCQGIQESILDFLTMDQSYTKVYKKLSQREFEIANQIIEGVKTSVIADKLGLKSSTVSTIKSKVYVKLGVTNAIELREKMRA